MEKMTVPRQIDWRLTLILALPILLVSSYLSLSAGSEGQTAITVSGVVTGPQGPVSGVSVGIDSPYEWKITTTNAGGYYAVEIMTDSSLAFEVRPDISTRLAQINLWLEDVSGDVTQDFSLLDGYLLDVLFLDSEGQSTWLEDVPEVWPLMTDAPDGQWYSLEWDDPLGRYRAVLPPDVYQVSSHNPPEGYYETSQTCDLRQADQAIDVLLNTSYVHPIPYDPPDASKINMGTMDGLGQVEVSGTPGAVLPLSHVLLVNLDSSHQVPAFSDSDGSFSTHIYAPPGSAILIKHGPAHRHWRDLEYPMPYPGTIIHTPQPPAASNSDLPFAAVGNVELLVDQFNQYHVGAAWAITGTLSAVDVNGTWTRVLTGTYEGETVPGLYMGSLYWSNPTLGDLDDDGDLELLVGSDLGRLLLYRNKGSSTTPDWRLEDLRYADILYDDFWVYPALADVTGDGAPDLFVGQGDGTVSIYHNHGSAATPAWPRTSDSTLYVGHFAAPALDDLDNDGDLDLLVGHDGGTLHHFQNTGTLTSPNWTFRTETYAGISEADWTLPGFIDLDRDGDQDLKLGTIWYERGGTLTNPTWTRHGEDPIGYGFYSSGSPGIADWNGDGLADLVAGEQVGNLFFFQNDGASGWSERFFPFPLEHYGISAPTLADWDDDGDLDMLVGQEYGDIYQYTNIGNNSQPDWRPDGILLSLPEVGPFAPPAFPTLADIDGDLDHELFIGGGGNLLYYQNDGSPTVPDWVLITDQYMSLDTGSWIRPVFVDIDDDADQDLFLGNEQGTLTFVENTGTATEPGWAEPIQTYADLDLGEHSAPSFLDIDQDGDKDMLVGLYSGSLAYVKNTGTVESPAWELITTIYPGAGAVAPGIEGMATPTTADLNGDGKPDLMIGDRGGGIHHYLYEGQGKPSPPLPNVAPGDLMKIEGSIRLYGPAITETTDLNSITAEGWVDLLILADGNGRVFPRENHYLSTMMTPTGLPVLSTEQPIIPFGAEFSVENLRHYGDQAIEGDVSMVIRLPEELAEGSYQPLMRFRFSNIPTTTDWPALSGFELGGNFELSSNEAVLPPIKVGQGEEAKLIWQLLMEELVQGARGTGAREDDSFFGLASHIVTQDAPFYVPPVDLRSGQPIAYRLEPFLPTISYGQRTRPFAPLIPFDLPGGELCVSIQAPDGQARNLGCETFAQSFMRTKTTRGGEFINLGTSYMNDVYALKTASDRFLFTFDQYGHHVITMTGYVADNWGNIYEGGGTYDLWVAQPLDIDPGILPGTPLAVGDVLNPAMQFYPRVPADVTLKVTHYPYSDPARMERHTRTGQANRFGYFNVAGDPITVTEPGEFRIDAQAIYTDADGIQYMGTMTWGSVVMTPENEAQLIAHGRRGLDSLSTIPNHWFFLENVAPEGGHTYNPYYNGDILWSRDTDLYGGDALLLGACVQDTIGITTEAVRARISRLSGTYFFAPPGVPEERLNKGAIPLISTTRSGLPIQLVLGPIGQEIPDDVDMIAYSYRSSQRPGVRVREVIAEDGQGLGYWRLATLYDDQLGVGVLGDNVNDFKFQYVGTVYRDFDSGLSEYAGQGSAWIFLPEDDLSGSRVMPPFAGPGNGGWTTEGGPILTLKGQDIHMFILPTGVRPGAVLEEGDIFHFGGHLMPTLNSRVAVTVTAPGGTAYHVDGRANKIGYFYDPADNFEVDEPGLWTVDVRVWHDGQIGTGQSVDCDPTDPFDPARPCPSGDVLGSANGRYVFYVVPPGAESLGLTSPSPGFLHISGAVTPITISGPVPGGLSEVIVDYTISMPGTILKQGQATVSGGVFSFTYDPVTLNQDFPNLDLGNRSRHDVYGLSDTIAIGLLLQGNDGPETVYRATTVTLQGEQVFVELLSPPKANAGGPYSGEEGNPIALDGSGSADATGISLYEWDCEDDGVWDTSSTHSGDSTCTYGDNGTYTVGLRVTAASGLTGTMATTAEVINLPPVVNAGPNQEVIKGVPTTFGGSFFDPGWLDNHVIEWNFGDGESASGTLTPTHTYSLPDVYSVKLTVTDDDSGVGSETLTVTVGDPFIAYLPLVLK